MYICKKVEGTSYLVADFNKQCYDGKWKDYLPYSLIMVALYPIGIPPVCRREQEKSVRLDGRSRFHLMQALMRIFYRARRAAGQV